MKSNSAQQFVKNEKPIYFAKVLITSCAVNFGKVFYKKPLCYL
ncbi:hypothetical protein CAPSP0001_1205 [Capnocytophaga sputigena ATCC 33612]|nr:hypothetical protein CAPSP0001_1205 [Capnocytophaga sputigena ATCC 33612]